MDFQTLWIQILSLSEVCAVHYNLHKNSQTVKKGVAHAKKGSMKKSCEIKGGGPEVAVVVW